MDVRTRIGATGPVAICFFLGALFQKSECHSGPFARRSFALACIGNARRRRRRRARGAHTDGRSIVCYVEAIGQTSVANKGLETAEMAALRTHRCELRPRSCVHEMIVVRRTLAHKRKIWNSPKESLRVKQSGRKGGCYSRAVNCGLEMPPPTVAEPDHVARRRAPPTTTKFVASRIFLFHVVTPHVRVSCVHWPCAIAPRRTAGSPLRSAS